MLDLKSSPFLRAAAGVLTLLPMVAAAIDWSGATGPFGTGSNWAGGNVPSANSANIANSGTATIAGGNSFSVTTLFLGNHSGTGSITQSGGAITSTSQVSIGGDNANGGTGTGSYTISGGTLTSSGGGEFWVGSRGGTGTLTLSGNAVVSTNSTTNIGRDASGTGTLIIGGTSELKSATQDINVGVNTGNFNSSITVQDSGKLSSGNELAVGLIGSNATRGNLTVKDSATVTSAGSLVVGKLGVRGAMNVSGDSTVKSGTYLIVGTDSSGSKGELTIGGNAVVNAARQIWLGNSGSTGAITLNGGTLKVHSYNGDDGGAGISFRGNSTLTLNGGTLETPGFYKTSGTASVLLNGGLIKANAAISGNFFNNFGSSDITLQAGGAKFDSNGYSLSIDTPLSGSGGLIKSGAGSLLLNGVNTFTGTTQVSAGTLGGNGKLTGALTVAAGATLNPGVVIGTFSAGPTTIAGTYACQVSGNTCDQLVVTGDLDISAGSLAISSVNQPTAPALVIGSYSGAQPAPFATVSGMPSGYQLDYHYQGSGQIALVRTGGTAFEEWIAAAFPGQSDPAVIGPDADPDHDGRANALEFALGGTAANGSDAGACYMVPATTPVLTIAVRSGTPAFTAGPAPAAMRDGFLYTVRGSRDLDSSGAAVTPVATVTTGLPPAPANYEYRSFAMAGEGARGFLRVEVSAYSGEDLSIGNFDGSTYGPTWTATGTAFSQGPANGPLITQLQIQNADGGVASSEIQGDGPQGHLISAEFTIQRRYISFSIAGGDYERHACLNLLVDGKIMKSATGRYSDYLNPASWDVGPWLGRTARIEIVDEASGGWGHVNVGRIEQTDTPAVLPIDKGVLYQESLRPQLHFTARQWTMDRLNPGMRQEGWLNDLNGLVYYEGEYHLFAQRWNKCWIHAVSTDLVHWTELEPAFWEEQLDSGVQSGSCVIDYGNTSGLGADPAHPPMVAFWSRNDNNSHCISYSLDKGRSWTHYVGNPILSFPERDPKVFRHAASNQWVMVMYGSGKYHIFTSPDLLHWTNQNHPINNAFECPDFFEIPLAGNPAVKKWALIHADSTYSLGTFSGTQFTEETPRMLCDFGGTNFYATQSFNNTETGDGRRIQMAWMRGSDFPGMPFSQQVSFPCEMTLQQTPGGLRLFRQPVAELSLLENPGQSWSNLSLTAGQQMPLAASGDLYRIRAQLSIPAGATFSFNLRGFNVTLTSTSLNAGTGANAVQGQLTSVEFLVDRASVESFANGGELSCTRYFQPSAAGISMSASGGTVTLQSLSVVPLKSMWEGL
ncbi:GH32 C-terminal domain-containing protein [Haloferula sp. BvORR071]|uniref:GH32 C-terminal domain-containing protein n=1 Tax=Haloferula sp. BvORR071 TaxID=1396141 RepID=UPI000698A3CE|nr:GH32 C-terminal domain-containing protein [Haloferula sp. BvORR071]